MSFLTTKSSWLEDEIICCSFLWLLNRVFLTCDHIFPLSPGPELESPQLTLYVILVHNIKHLSVLYDLNKIHTSMSKYCESVMACILQNYPSNVCSWVIDGCKWKYKTSPGIMSRHHILCLLITYADNWSFKSCGSIFSLLTILAAVDQLHINARERTPEKPITMSDVWIESQACKESIPF